MSFFVVYSEVTRRMRTMLKHDVRNLLISYRSRVEFSHDGLIFAIALQFLTGRIGQTPERCFRGARFNLGAQNLWIFHSFSA